MEKKVFGKLKSKDFWKYRLRAIFKHVIISTSVIMYLHLLSDSGYTAFQKLIYAIAYGIFIGVFEDLFSFTF